MQDKYIITVVGEQTVDDEKDKIEVITSGHYEQKDGVITVTYPEFSEEDPNIRTDTTVTLSGGRLTIERRGEMSSRLLLEEGRRHQCLYDSPMGQMMIGIYTDRVRCRLDEHGGEIRASYQLDFSGAAVSYNELHITIKEKG